MPECINLQKMYGKSYRITFDPSYDPFHVPKSKLDPWMMQIPCKGQGVTIYPFDAESMAIEVDYRGNCARALAKLGLKLHQDGDHEKTFLFSVAQFDAVAEIVKPRKKRVLSEEQKASLAKHGFKPKKA